MRPFRWFYSNAIGTPFRGANAAKLHEVNKQSVSWNEHNEDAKADRLSHDERRGRINRLVMGDREKPKINWRLVAATTSWVTLSLGLSALLTTWLEPIFFQGDIAKFAAMVSIWGTLSSPGIVWLALPNAGLGERMLKAIVLAPLLVACVPLFMVMVPLSPFASVGIDLFAGVRKLVLGVQVRRD